MRDEWSDPAAQTAALRESEARLALATSAAGLGVWEWRLDSDEIVYSRRACEIYGFDPDAPVTYEMVAAATHPDDRLWTSEKTHRAFDPDICDRTPYEYRISRPDGAVRTVYAQGEAVFEDGPTGPRAIRYVGTLADVTERRKMEAELRRSEATLKLAMEAARMAVWQFDIATNAVVLTPGLTQIFGFAEDAKPSLEEVRAGYNAVDLEAAWSIGRAALAAGEDHFEAEFRYRCPGGELRWFLMRAQVTTDSERRPQGALGIVMDINERKAAEDRLRLLAREVDHRANNLLTVVQSTVALSSAPTAEALKDVLAGRVFALARAHQLLADGRWEGADLRRVIEEELAPYVGVGERRVILEGGDVALPPQIAQSVGMAIHELATNAVKYGALSTREGVVAISWGREGPGELHLRWEERGGPKVAPPTRRGLGVAMLDRALSASGGVTDFEWRTTGIICRIAVPMTEAQG